MFTRGSLRRDGVNDVINDADGASEGLYGCTRGTICVHVRAIMGSREPGDIGLASRAESARVTKHFVTVFSKEWNKYMYFLIAMLS